MKNLIITLLLMLAGAAQATTWEMPNRTGGKIVATDRPCPKSEGDGLLYIYSYISSGEVLEGCWSVMDRTAIVIWFNGQMTVHAIDVFKEMGEAKLRHTRAKHSKA